MLSQDILETEDISVCEGVQNDHFDTLADPLSDPLTDPVADLLRDPDEDQDDDLLTEGFTETTDDWLEDFDRAQAEQEAKQQEQDAREKRVRERQTQRAAKEAVAGAPRMPHINIKPKTNPYGSEFFYIGPGAIISDRGVFKMRQDHKGNEIVDLLTPLMIRPVGVLQPADDEEEYIEVEYQTAAGKLRRKIVAAQDFARLPGLEGFALPDGMTRNRVNAILLEALVALRKSGEIPVKTGSLSGGWFKGEHLRPGHPSLLVNTVPLSATAGDPQVWRETMNAAIANSKHVALAVAAAFGSYGRGAVFSTDTSHIMYFHGEPGSGKTTALWIASSIQGRPEKGQKGACIFEGASTMVSVENLLAASTHGFIGLDEIDDIFGANGMSANRPVERLMYYCNGGGRAKFDRQQAGSVNVGVSWNCTIFSSGNTDIATRMIGHQKADALADRMIQVEVMKGDTVDNSQITDWMRTLQQNYGHGYKPAIDYITQNRAELEDWAAQQFRELLMDSTLAEYAQRHLKLYVLCALGCEIAHQVLGEEAAQLCRDAVDETFQRVVNNAQTRESDNDGLLEEFKQWVYDNAQRFRVGGGVLYHANGDKEYGNRCNGAALEKGNPLGLIQIADGHEMQSETDFKGTIYIAPLGKQEAEKVGLPFQQIINQAKRQGILQRGDGRNDSRKATGEASKALGRGSRCLTFKFD